MRSWICAVTLLAGCSSPDAPLPPPASFEFRGLVAGKSTMRDAVSGAIVRGCRDDGRCTSVETGFGAVGGAPITIGFGARGIFESLWVSFRGADFPAWRDQARAVYGSPCATSSRQMQNLYGATIELASAQWCFREGRLTIANGSESDVTQGYLSFASRGAAGQPETLATSPGEL